jgi:23S rRNA pseudouridine2605 synthase
MAERLQRYLARAGVASRRHAETLITAGRVTVNNQLATTLGTKVEPNDLVALDGKLVMPPEAVSWYVLYKPAGVVTTLDDPQGRPTVLGLLGAIPTRVFPIGRLDWDAEGALLLTDDGSAAHRLLHPSFQVPRTYLAKVKGAPTDESLARLVAGVRLEDGPAKALEVERFSAAERNTWLRLTVGEGRPHLVKRLCAAIGHPVVRLFRPHQAGISVAGMQPGELRALRPEELAVIAAVAAGQPVPPMTLTLPARRHGRADDDSESEGDGGAQPRPPKPPRFGTRQWRNAKEGGGQVRLSRDAGKTPRSAPPFAGFEHGGPAHSGGTDSPPAGRGAGVSGRRGPPAAPAGLERGKAPRRGEGTANRGRDAPRETRGAAGHGRGDWGHGPPGARAGSKGSTRSEGFGRQESDGRDFRAKSAEGRGGFSSAKRGPPGARAGSRAGGPSARGQTDGRPGSGGRDSRAKPAGGRGGFSGARRGPPGARPDFEGGGASAPRAGGRRDFHARPPGGRGGFSSARRGPPGARPDFEGRPPAQRPGGFRAKPSGGRGSFSGARRGPTGATPGFERGRAPSHSAGAKGGRGLRRGPGERKGGVGRRPPSSSSGPRPADGRGGPGRPPEGRRGPRRPRGGGPRSPRR